MRNEDHALPPLLEGNATDDCESKVPLQDGAPISPSVGTPAESTLTIQDVVLISPTIGTTDHHALPPLQVVIHVFLPIGTPNQHSIPPPQYLIPISLPFGTPDGSTLTSPQDMVPICLPIATPDWNIESQYIVKECSNLPLVNTYHAILVRKSYTMSSNCSLTNFLTRTAKRSMMR